MPRYTLLALAALAFSALAVSCGGSGNGGDNREGPLNVVTSIAPITSLVENVGGTKIELRGLVPEDADSHSFEPPATAEGTLKEADLIIVNGLGLDDQILALARAIGHDEGTILLLGDSELAPEEYSYDPAFPESGGRPNPHAWLDPVMAADYATLIRDRLVELDSRNKDYYDANLKELSKRLEHLDQQIRIAVQTVPQQNRNLVTYHDSWAYWARRYGTTAIAIEGPNFAEPSASERTALIAQIQTQEIPAVFGPAAGGILERIAKESGADYAGDLPDDDLPDEAGDPFHTYIGLMVRDIGIMIPALGGDASPLERVQQALVFGDGQSSAEYP